MREMGQGGGAEPFQMNAGINGGLFILFNQLWNRNDGNDEDEVDEEEENEGEDEDEDYFNKEGGDDGSGG